MKLNWREIVSRTAMLAMGTLAIAGGAGLWHLGRTLQPYDDPDALRRGDSYRNPNAAERGYSYRGSNSNYCYRGAWGLFGIGGVFIAGALRPPTRES